MYFAGVPLAGFRRSVWLLHTSQDFTDKHSNNGPRSIFLPLKEEALFLFELYVQYVSYLHHVIHVPTTRNMVHEVYSDLDLGQVS